MTYCDVSNGALLKFKHCELTFPHKLLRIDFVSFALNVKALVVVVNLGCI